MGPKGMFALERLFDHAARLAPDASIQLDIFEPHHVPGAGPIYDPSQPDYLRINYAAEQLDAWWPGGDTVPDFERLSFSAWRQRRAKRDADQSKRADAHSDSYPPRARVGEYLADCLRLLLRHTPPNVDVELFGAPVVAVHRREDHWEVITASSSACYDELMIAVGHQRAWEDGLAASWQHAAALVPSVFPVGSQLSTEQVAAGSTVAVRGFALSFIDAALALTEGRGGCFQPLEHPYRLRYQPGADDVGLILPFSRSGRPMLVKPTRQMLSGLPDLEPTARDGRSQLLRLGSRVDLHADVLPIIATTAANSLLLADRGLPQRDPCAPQRERHSPAAPPQAMIQTMTAILSDTARGIAPAVSLSPAQELEQSLAVAVGVHPPDLQWSLGHSWRVLYPALVTRLSGDGLPDAQWPAFRCLARQLERIAFGPPPVNAAKLLALVAAGRVDLTHVAGARLATEGTATALRSKHGKRAVDVVLDAVLAPPGARGLHSTLLTQLVADGYARIAAGRRGLQVCADASCVGRDGAVTPGLSVSGRPTEDSVIGNDTLSRALHPHADHWARRVALGAREQAGSPKLSELAAGARA